jgi:hypothetical protein
MTSPSTGYVQDETSLDRPPLLISTTHSLHAPYGDKPSMWQSVGIGNP